MQEDGTSLNPSSCPAAARLGLSQSNLEVGVRRSAQVMSVLPSLGSEKRPVLRFEAENISNYTALLLSQDGKTLYVGAREALFALSSGLSFLPGGEYQQVRGIGKTPMGEGRGPVPHPPPCPLTSPSVPSYCGRRMQTGNSSAASRARTHR